jgi:hypothetical protein
MIFCVTWGVFQLDALVDMPDATQGEVNAVLGRALAPYAIGRAILREMEIQAGE